MSTSVQVRIVNGPNSLEGLVEVLYNNQWGTICYNGWDYNDALVVCKQNGMK